MSDNPEIINGNDAPGLQLSGRRRRAFTVLFICLCLSLGIFLWLWVQSRIYVTTDNAFVEAPIHTVSARIAGQIYQLPVDDNQPVKAGDLLVQLDPTDYEIALRRATAFLQQAGNETGSDEALVDEAAAAVQQARALREQAAADLKRGEALLGRDVLPLEQVERLRSQMKIADAKLREALQAQRRAASRAGLTGEGRAKARIAQRQAEIDEAARNLAYTKILSPTNGYVTGRNAEVGNNVRPGQTLMAVVDLDKAWVVANLKETQLAHVRPGQQVKLRFDAFPGEIFDGRVESLMAGTGAAFSLLPPENATGNYVKVVQRVPVKILLAPNSPAAARMRVGMSVVPTIDTGRSILDALADLNPLR